MVSRNMYLGFLIALLLAMSVGVYLALNHLYSIPEKIIMNTSVSTTGSSSTSPLPRETKINASGVIAFRSLEELRDYIKSNSPSSWYRPIEFNVYTTTVPTTTAATVYIGEKNAAVAPPQHSGTNVQVPGIDEADVVKTDGFYLYMISRGAVKIVKIYPLSKARLVSTIKFDNKIYPVGLLVSNDTLIVIAESIHIVPLYEKSVTTVTASNNLNPTLPEGPVTRILLYNISSRDKPSLIGSHMVSGSYIGARLSDYKLILVTQEPIFTILRSGVKAVPLPLVDREPLPIGRIYFVPGTPPSSYAVVSSLNIRSGEINATSILCPPINRIYVSRNGVYLFSGEWLWNRGLELNFTIKVLSKYIDNQTMQLIEEIEENTGINQALKQQLITMILYQKVRELNRTQIEEIKKEFAVEAGKLIGKYTGPLTHVYYIRMGEKGWVIRHAKLEGRILDQFAIDEKKGYLRLAMTATVITGYNTYDYYPFIYPVTSEVNNIYVLNSTSLNLIGKLEGLSPGERVYSARYIGDTLYLVTFRRVDPLYAIDLSNPANPRVLGYAKFPGYSEYLHPINDTLLFGIGYSADKEGRINGIKASLYDLSDPMNIKNLSTIRLSGRGYSQVMYDYHAFLYNPIKKYVAIPLHYYNVTDRKMVGEAVVIGLDDGMLSILRTIYHQGVSRILYTDDYIITVSQTLVKITGPNGQTVSIKI